MSQPFMFVNDQGLFANPAYARILTTHGLKTLQNYAKLHASPVEKKMLDLALPLLAQLPTTIEYASLKKGDKQGLSAKDFRAHSKDYGMGSLKGPAMAVPKSFGAKFVPPVYVGAAFPSALAQWGWLEAKQLYPFKNELSKLCQKLEISFDASVITKSTKNHDAFHDGTLKIRVPNPTDTSASDAWVVYSASSGLYLNPHLNHNPWVNLCSAKMFESVAALEKACNTKSTKDLVIVKVKTQVVEIHPGQNLPKSLGPLNEALIVLQKEQILKALQDADVQMLRQRLKELDGAASPRPSSRKKM